VGERLAPGFPKHILVGAEVVDADPLLVHAAAFLDTMPLTERVSPEELATGIGVDPERAASILAQLEALGHAGRVDSGGERPIFDPDRPTVPPANGSEDE
jgi:hypothetical protein